MILCNWKRSILSLTPREQHITVTIAPFLLTQKYNLMEVLSISFAALETDKRAGLCQSVPAFHQPSTGTIIRFATVLFCVCAEGRFPQSEPWTGCYSVLVRQSHIWSWQHVAKLMRFWLSMMGQELTSSGRPFTFFFLSILDILYVFLSVINLLLEMGGLWIMIALQSWTKWFLEMTRWQYTAFLCVREHSLWFHHEIGLCEKKGTIRRRQIAFFHRMWNILILSLA